MKKSIIDKSDYVVIAVAFFIVCIVVDIVCCFQLMDNNHENKNETILIMSITTVIFVPFSFGMLNNAHIIKYNDNTEEITFKPVLGKKTICIKKSDIAEVVISASYKFTYVLITTVKFEELNKSEQQGYYTHRSISFYRNKKSLNFVKSFWDGEIERREYDFMTD